MKKLAKECFIQQHEITKISVYITFPNMPTKKVNVNSSDPISVLFQIFPNGNKTVFYQGEIIQSLNSFDKYGITNNDRIVIIPNQQISFNTEQFWRKATKRDFETKTQIESLQDPKMKLIISQQNDLLLTKFENNIKSYKLLISNLQNLTSESTKEEISTVLNWKKTESPNEISLPIIWKIENKFDGYFSRK
jgi:hypothetical protein